MVADWIEFVGEFPPARIREHVLYVVDLDSVPLHADLTSLDNPERRRGERIKVLRKRETYFRRKRALRAFLSTILNAAPSEISYRAGRYGKPLLLMNGCAAPIHFNTANCEGLFGVMYSRSRELGVDFEAGGRIVDHSAAFDLIAAREELDCLSGLPKCKVADRSKRLWVIKEAILKLSGTGFRKNARDICIPGDIIEQDGFSFGFRSGCLGETISVSFVRDKVNSLHCACAHYCD